MKNVKQRAFTLVELIIVIIILGILAALAMPQFVTSTDDAKAATVAANLAIMRNAIQLYYHQHNSTYPGEVSETDGSTLADAAAMATAFEEQLTSFSNVDGIVGTDRSTYPYGPYLQNGIPENPYKDNSRDVKVVTTAVDVSDGDTAPEGWQFSVLDGTFVSYVAP